MLVPDVVCDTCNCAACTFVLWKLLLNPHRFMENKKLLKVQGNMASKSKVKKKIKAKTYFMLLKLICYIINYLLKQCRLLFL